MKVSIIVPIYNNAVYLKDCLTSLTSQTLKEIEIIAIDDASTDESYQVLKDIASKNSVIHIYQNEKNLGQGATRNIGLDLATGEYIGFVDSDDFVHPEMYQMMYEGAVKNNYPTVVTTGISFIDSTAKFEDKKDTFQRRNGFVQSLEKDPMLLFWESPSCCNKIFRKDKIQELRFLEDCMWEDIAFTYSMMIRADTILSFANPDYCYRRNIQRGVSSKGYAPNPHILDIFSVGDSIAEESKKENKFANLKEVIRMIQISGCLQRLKEMSFWNLEEEEKKEAMQSMYHMATEKYGPIEKLDQALLSGKVDLDLVAKLEKAEQDQNKIRRYASSR